MVRWPIDWPAAKAGLNRIAFVTARTRQRRLPPSLMRAGWAGLSADHDSVSQQVVNSPHARPAGRTQ